MDVVLGVVLFCSILLLALVGIGGLLVVLIAASLPDKDEPK